MKRFRFAAALTVALTLTSAGAASAAKRNVAPAPAPAAAPAPDPAPAEPPSPRPAPKDADAPTVAARLDRQDAKIGDVVELTITAVGSTRVPVNLPAHVDLAPFEIVDRRERESALGDGKFRREFIFRIAAFETGDVTVPAVPLTYIARQGAVRSVSTLPLTLTIKSLLANEPDPPMKENAAPVAVLEEVRWPLYLLAALAAAVLGALVGSYVWARWRRRAKPAFIVPPRPAHEVALERLARLRGSLPAAEDLRPFYFDLSETLRGYFGGRYGFDSLELTTDELVAELERRDAKPLVASEVQGWLISCDLVKFAGVSPTQAEADAALEAGVRFVMTTQPPPPPPAGAGPAAPTAEEQPRA